MKKRIALVLAAMMAAGSIATVSFAEDAVTELNWSDVAEAVEKSGLEGDFVTFDEVAVQMWVPSVLSEVELTDEDKEAGFIGYFATEEGAEQEAAVSVVYVDLGGMELDAYAEELAGIDGVSEIELGYVNGLPCVSYEMEEQDSGSMTFMTEAGYALEVTCAPVSTEEAMTVAAYIMCSIMPTEEAEAATEAATE